MAKTTSKGKATVVVKVIRADGTEETFYSEEVSVSDTKAATDLLARLREKDGG